ncbi:hypothetical protein AAFF_G00025070 [Aldrovandia affinis]|uniref:Beta/gamma crystallin 'Greek key' domain-containing protein n=1 Tax=Aldrovandia affinis TaxID=143900 RepID=A0AAD7T5V8_9TELE|nr:hypothetical protein AAFF_G00025070 [Aldrovandia affinis]
MAQQAVLTETLLNPQTAKSAASHGTDSKDKGTPATGKTTKTGDPGMGSLRIMMFEQENFQGMMVEIQDECVNACDPGLDRVQSLIVECGL